MNDSAVSGSPPFSRERREAGGNPQRSLAAPAFTPSRPLPASNGTGAVTRTPAAASPIRLLIQSAEKERSELTDYRVRRVEGLFKEKEEERLRTDRAVLMSTFAVMFICDGSTQLASFKARFSQLRDDFEYNLRLLNERDAELARYDATLDSLKTAVAVREAQLGEARSMLAEIEAEARQEKAREGTLLKANEELRAQLQATKAEAEAEILRVREEAERARKDLEQASRAEAKWQQAASTAQALLRQKESEHAQATADLSTRCQAAEAGLKRKGDELEAEKRKAEALEREVGDLRHTLREAETKTATALQEAAESKRQRDERVAAVEAEQREVAGLRAELLEEYDRRSAELLQSLKLAEASLEAQRADQAAREDRLYSANKALRLRVDAMSARLEAAGVSSSGSKPVGAVMPDSEGWLVDGEEDELEVEAARAAQEIELLRGQVRALQRAEQEARAQAKQERADHEAREHRRCIAAQLLAMLALAYARTTRAVASSPAEGANGGLLGALKVLLHEVDSGSTLQAAESKLFRDERDEIELEVRRLKRLARASAKQGGVETEGPPGKDQAHRGSVDLGQSVGGGGKFSRGVDRRPSHDASEQSTPQPERKRSSVRERLPEDDELRQRGTPLETPKADGKENVKKEGSNLTGTTTWAEVRVVSQKEARAAMDASLGEGRLREKLLNMENCVRELVEAERRRQNREVTKDHEEEKVRQRAELGGRQSRRVTVETLSDAVLRRVQDADWEDSGSVRSSDRGEGSHSTARHSLRESSVKKVERPSRTPSPPLWRPAGGSLQQPVNRARSAGRSSSMLLPTKSSLARSKLSTSTTRRSLRNSIASHRSVH